jgi:hypothetical protein
MELLLQQKDVAKMTIEVAERGWNAAMQDAGNLHRLYTDPDELAPVRKMLASTLAEQGAPTMPVQWILEYAATLGYMVGRDFAGMISAYDPECSRPVTALGVVDFNCFVCRVRCGVA